MIRQLEQSDTVARLSGGIGGILSLWEPDVFFWLMIVLVVSNAADWLFGRHAARARKRPDGRSAFSRRESRNGLARKASTLTVLLLLRSLEAILPLVGTPSTRGALSSAIATLLIVEDLESIERHGVQLGGRPIPLLSTALDKIRQLTGSERRMVQTEAHPSRRKADASPPALEAPEQ